MRTSCQKAYILPLVYAHLATSSLAYNQPRVPAESEFPISTIDLSQIRSAPKSRNDSFEALAVQLFRRSHTEHSTWRQ